MNNKQIVVVSIIMVMFAWLLNWRSGNSDMREFFDSCITLSIWINTLILVTRPSWERRGENNGSK